MSTSPSKRRVLADIDPNASLSFSSPKAPLAWKQAKADPVTPGTITSTSRTQTRTPSPDVEPRKRDLAMEGEPAAKRACIEANSRPRSQDVKPEPESQESPARRRSSSPTASSVFDNSAIDTSQVTTLTEPDAEHAPAAAPAPPAVPIPTVDAASPAQRRSTPRLTREEAREKAEILRLRLGLANYKVRTGQTDVPLEQLQVRHLPDGFQRRLAAAAAAQSALFQRHASQSSPAQSTRHPLPGAPTRRASEAGDAAPPPRQQRQQQPPRVVDNCEEEEEEEEEQVDKNDRLDSQEEISYDGLPRLPPTAAGSTPSRRRRLPDGAAGLVGGAASGLLSLSRS
ncbi:hypothetical protein B0T22DRAFT_15497 [Podospora appendiculata]|uniref:Cyclin-dependent kinase n=1 Tax=Podospora appendiculata TaxID=314037 RepID=A0AAE1CFD2_9PEZI|nr:hypothetical protein B0T22DRAFT_15497 [Podospora appendiculata]